MEQAAAEKAAAEKAAAEAAAKAAEAAAKAAAEKEAAAFAAAQAAQEQSEPPPFARQAGTSARWLNLKETSPLQVACKEVCCQINRLESCTRK